jgi:hypothetical protein
VPVAATAIASPRIARKQIPVNFAFLLAAASGTSNKGNRIQPDAAPGKVSVKTTVT